MMESVSDLQKLHDEHSKMKKALEQISDCRKPDKQLHDWEDSTALDICIAIAKEAIS